MDVFHKIVASLSGLGRCHQFLCNYVYTIKKHFVVFLVFSSGVLLYVKLKQSAYI